MKSITSSFLSGLLCIVIALTTSSSLSGCVVAPWDMFRTQEGWEPSNYYIDQYLVYDGNPIELTMVLGGYVEACEIGVLVFIDGIIQVYHTEQAEQDAYIHNSKYAANERREVTLFVEPNIGSKGETLYLGTVVIKNPDAVL
ncbi:MAG: hypothetical protein LBU61_01165, partial [Coriobacteriales bacterium]|nr:hypothetical protein [Coriobacteriales bacterium]